MNNETKMYLRNPRALVAANHSGVVLISPSGSSVCIRSKVPQICALMELLREPRSREDIERELKVQFSDIVKLVGLLEKRHIILSQSSEKLAGWWPPVRPKATAPPCKRVVVGICGAVQAAVTIPLLVTIQRTIAAEVEIVLTEAAERFVRPETLSYFGFRVWNDVHGSSDRVNPETSMRINVPHIYLASAADLVLILPATASTVHRLASGACSDLISLVVSATKAPVIVVPTMNTAMLEYPPVRRNLEEIRSCGMYVVEPSLGYEVSAGSDDELRFIGIGLTEANLVRGILAILAADRELIERNLTEICVPAKTVSSPASSCSETDPDLKNFSTRTVSTDITEDDLISSH
jgi:phosphopantothenoylcysteine decarboxylase/phosphopantothenate--cysteine ligase